MFQVFSGGLKLIRTLTVTLLFISSLVLTACVEGGTGLPTVAASSANKTDEERKLEAEAKSLNKVTGDIIARNTVQGVAVGAIAGCGIALLLGGDAADCAAGAVVGGVAGGVAGNAAGRAAANANKELIKRDRLIADLKGVSTRLNGVEARLNSVLRAQNAEINSLNRQLKSKQISQSSYSQRMQAINSNRKVVSGELLKSEKNIAKTRNEIKAAQQQGQQGLVSADRAAASNQARLAKTRQQIKLLNI
jgi:hypothetical protein